MKKLIQVLINSFSVGINHTIAAAYGLKNGDTVDPNIQEKLVLDNSEHMAAIEYLIKDVKKRRNN